MIRQDFIDKFFERCCEPPIAIIMACSLPSGECVSVRFCNVCIAPVSKGKGNGFVRGYSWGVQKWGQCLHVGVPAPKHERSPNTERPPNPKPTQTGGFEQSQNCRASYEGKRYFFIHSTCFNTLF